MLYIKYHRKILCWLCVFFSVTEKVNALKLNFPREISTLNFHITPTALGDARWWWRWWWWCCFPYKWKSHTDHHYANFDARQPSNEKQTTNKLLCFPITCQLIFHLFRACENKRDATNHIVRWGTIESHWKFNVDDAFNGFSKLCSLEANCRRMGGWSDNTSTSQTTYFFIL